MAGEVRIKQRQPRAPDGVLEEHHDGELDASGCPGLVGTRGKGRRRGGGHAVILKVSEQRYKRTSNIRHRTSKASEVRCPRRSHLLSKGKTMRASAVIFGMVGWLVASAVLGA